jgi:uncharacterized protein YdhG (YjbR/CyaY superfamily)
MSKASADGETEVLAVIAAMSEADRAIGEQLHQIIATTAPDLIPRTWYGMPAYSKQGRVVCFFRSRQKFGERYMTLGFNDTAKLDNGNLWPISFALTKLTAAEEAQVRELIKQAVS